MATIVSNPGSTTRPANKTASVKDTIGLAFPFRKEAGEFPKRAINVDAVKNDLIALFRTPFRSRVMRPIFGSTKEQLVFESTGPLLRARLERNIRQTIIANEPRVVVIAVNVVESDTLVTATVVYVTQGISDSIDLTISKST